jgi:hypothetical protein
LALLASPYPILGVICVIATAVVAVFAAHYDRTQRITSLHYDLGDHLPKFVERQRICKTLSRSMKVWRVTTRESTSDWKRNAGAGSLVGRKEVLIRKAMPPCIETNIEVWGIDLGSTILYFLPDFLLVLQNGRYGGIGYESLAADFSSTRFIEDSYAPGDATIVDHTWQYVRKDGGPDRRFNNNRQLPIVMYGVLILTSASGLNIHLQCSNLEIAKQVAEQVDQQRSPRSQAERSKAHKSQEEQPKARKPHEERDWRPTPASGAGKSDYEILEVSINATSEEITAAYFRLAKMYHPDKVESLAPEYKAIAVARMTEINGAYARLRSRQQA